MMTGFGRAELKIEGERIDSDVYTASKSFDWTRLVPEWIGRRIRNIAYRIYQHFDIYGS